MFPVPSPPRGLQLSLSQEDPPIVLVTWSTPRHAHGAVVGYKLTYGVRGDSYIEERRFENDKYRFTTGFLGERSLITTGNNQGVSSAALSIEEARWNDPCCAAVRALKKGMYNTVNFFSLKKKSRSFAVTFAVIKPFLFEICN